MIELSTIGMYFYKCWNFVLLAPSKTFPKMWRTKCRCFSNKRVGHLYFCKISVQDGLIKAYPYIRKWRVSQYKYWKMVSAKQYTELCPAHFRDEMCLRGKTCTWKIQTLSQARINSHHRGKQIRSTNIIVINSRINTGKIIKLGSMNIYLPMLYIKDT